MAKIEILDEETGEEIIFDTEKQCMFCGSDYEVSGGVCASCFFAQRRYPAGS